VGLSTFEITVPIFESVPAELDLLCGLPRYVDPARVALTRDLYAYQLVESMLVDAVVAVAHDGAVDIS
jgi:hypothetical protein